MFLAGWSYVNAVVAYSQLCSGTSYSAVACQIAIAENGLTTYWMFAGLALFVVGLWATARSFMAGEDVLAPKQPPSGRLCPACRTMQTGQFCPNDGTKLF